MKELRIDSFGPPADVVRLVEVVRLVDVVRLVEVDEPTPAPGQLVVALEAAPINPSDLLLIQGVYGIRPDLPARLGAEGVGRLRVINAFPRGSGCACRRRARWDAGAEPARGPRTSSHRRPVVTELHTRPVVRPYNLPPVQLGNTRPVDGPLDG